MYLVIDLEDEIDGGWRRGRGNKERK